MVSSTEYAAYRWCIFEVAPGHIKTQTPPYRHSKVSQMAPCLSIAGMCFLLMRTENTMQVKVVNRSLLAATASSRAESRAHAHICADMSHVINHQENVSPFTFSSFEKLLSLFNCWLCIFLWWRWVGNSTAINLILLSCCTHNEVWYACHEC